MLSHRYFFDSRHTGHCFGGLFSVFSWFDSNVSTARKNCPEPLEKLLWLTQSNVN